MFSFDLSILQVYVAEPAPKAKLEQAVGMR